MSVDLIFLFIQKINHGPKRDLIHRSRDKSIIRPLLYHQATTAGSTFGVCKIRIIRHIWKIYLVDNTNSSKLEAVQYCSVHFNNNTILPQTAETTCVQTKAFGNSLKKWYKDLKALKKGVKKPLLTFLLYKTEYHTLRWFILLLPNFVLGCSSSSSSVFFIVIKYRYF